MPSTLEELKVGLNATLAEMEGMLKPIKELSEKASAASGTLARTVGDSKPELAKTQTLLSQLLTVVVDTHANLPGCITSVEAYRDQL